MRELIVLVDKYTLHCTSSVLRPAAELFLAKLDRVRFTFEVRCFQETTIEDVKREHAHMLDTASRECLLTDEQLVMAVERILDDAVELSSRVGHLTDTYNTDCRRRRDPVRRR